MSQTTYTGVRIADMPNLGAVTDSSLVVGERAGSGLFSAPALRAYIGGAVSVKAYGAVGDGVADDTAAINAALAAYRCVIIPEGTYKLSGPINVTQNGQHIIGAGRYATILKSASTTADVISIATGLNGVTIEHLMLDRSVTATPGADGISVPGTSEFARFSDLVIQNQYNGMTLGGAGYCYIENVASWLNQGNGFLLTNPATMGAMQWSFNNCLAEQNVLNGFCIQAVSGPTAIALGEFTNCSTYANSNCGFSASGVAGCPIYGVRITGGFFGGDGNHEVFLDTRGGEHKIVGLFTELAGTSPTGPTMATPASNAAAGFQFTANNFDVQLSGCYAEGHSLSGFISNAGEVMYNGCKAINNGQAAGGGDHCGFNIQSGRPSFHGVRAGNLGGNTTQLYGIQIANATGGALIWGADLTGNTTQPLNIIAGTAGLTSGGVIPSGNLLLPFGGVAVGTPTGGAIVGGINVATSVAQNGTNYTNP